MTKNAAAKIAPVIRKVVRLPIANARSANRRSGTIGSLTRLSQARNTSSRTAPAASVPTVSALDQPMSLARMSAQTIATTPP